MSRNQVDSASAALRRVGFACGRRLFCFFFAAPVLAAARRGPPFPSIGVAWRPMLVRKAPNRSGDAAAGRASWGTVRPVVGIDQAQCLLHVRPGTCPGPAPHPTTNRSAPRELLARRRRPFVVVMGTGNEVADPSGQSMVARMSTSSCARNAATISRSRSDFPRRPPGPACAMRRATAGTAWRPAVQAHVVAAVEVMGSTAGIGRNDHLDRARRLAGSMARSTSLSITISPVADS